MSSVHGKNTVIKVATKDLSVFVTNSVLPRQSTVHGLTGYGAVGEGNKPGLLKSQFTMDGFYDNTVSTGPRAVLMPLVGTIVAVVRQPEGTGVGKPNEAFNGVLEDYTETSPSTDYVKWSAKITLDGWITDTTQ